MQSSILRKPLSFYTAIPSTMAEIGPSLKSMTSSSELLLASCTRGHENLRIVSDEVKKRDGATANERGAYQNSVGKVLNRKAEVS